MSAWSVTPTRRRPTVNPTSGLHANTNLTDHDSTLTGGQAPNTAGCEACHTPSPSTTHQDNTRDTPSVWDGNNIPAGYVADTGDGTDGCAGFCHSDGGTWNREWNSSFDGTVVLGSDADDDVGNQVCGNCHGTFASGWNIVGNTSHGNPDPDNDANATTGDDPDTLATSKGSHGICSKCHGWAHASYTAAMHNSGVDDIQTNATLSYDNADPDATCSTNCHAGQTLTMKSDSGWTDASIAGDGVACADCHLGGVNTSSASGAHAAHGATTASVSGDPASVAVCLDCHAEDGTNPGGTHNDGNLDFATNLTYSAARGVLTGTCSGTSGCHVAATNIQWNETQATVDDCSVCHQNSADTNDYNGTNDSASMVSSTEYSNVGHGLAANGNKTCMDCHDISVGHDVAMTGPNPFRLGDPDAVGGFTCSEDVAGCHVAAQATNEAALGLTYGTIVNHERANFASPYVETWGFTPKCVDCHDPHGDGSNAKMIHDDLWDNGSGANWVPTDYGTIGNTNLAFTTYTTGQDNTGNAYANTVSPWSSVCQECHETADADMTSYKDGVRADTSPHPSSPGDCSGCHQHNTAFQPSGCSGCHGGTVGTDADGYWPDGDSGGGDNPEDDAGQHPTHITQLAQRVWGETIAQILTDNTGTPLGGTKTSDEKAEEALRLLSPRPVRQHVRPGERQLGC